MFLSYPLTSENNFYLVVDTYKGDKLDDSKNSID